MNHAEIATRAYIEAVYFTETGDADQPPADAKLTPLFKAQAFIDCRNFVWAVTEELEINPAYINWEQVGHDLWLTRNGHGAGFWDRDQSVYGVLENGTELKTIYTAIAKAIGGHDAEWEDE